MTRNKIYQKSPDEWNLQSRKPAIPNSQPRYVVKNDCDSYWSRLEDAKAGGVEVEMKRMQEAVQD